MSTKRLLSAFAMGAGLTLTSVTASAALLPFCVNDTALGGVGAFSNNVVCAGAGTNVGTNGFSVDKVTGDYVEKLRVTSLNADNVSGTFKATIVFDINAYSYLGQNVGTGLNVDEAFPGTNGVGYNLYAVVTATGSFAGQSFIADPGVGTTLKIYGDANQDANLTLGSINDLSLAFGGAGVGDVLLGSSTALVSGSGNTAAAGGTDGFAVTFTDFNLENGDNFWIAPRPFYINLFSDGDITDPTFVFDPTQALTTLAGEASANFLPVPEPGSLALVGLALFALGAAGRRKA